MTSVREFIGKLSKHFNVFIAEIDNSPRGMGVLASAIWSAILRVSISRIKHMVRAICAQYVTYHS